MSEIKRFVAVGGGFAGVTFAQCLERLLPTQMEVVRSAENHLVFTPMLPEVVGRRSLLHVVAAGCQLTLRIKWQAARPPSIVTRAATAYVCENFVHQLPNTMPEVLAQLLFARRHRRDVW